MTNWKCKQCGQCCRHIDTVPSMRRFAREDGSCIFLRGNLCSIYDRRPLVCNVGAIYEKFFKDTVPEDLFYEKTARACAELQKGIVSSHEHSEPGQH